MELNPLLIEAYINGASLRECERTFGVQKDTISYNLRKLGIAVKSKKEVIAEQYAGAPWRDKDLMLDLYLVQKLSTIQIAKKLSCDSSVVSDWLNVFGATMRTTAETQISKVPATKGKGKRSSEETVLCACGCGTRLKRFNIGSNEVRFANGHRIKGEAHPLYKPWSGNKIKKHTSAEYREWRRQVLTAPNFTCTECGQVGGKLQSHHVAAVAKHPGLMFEVGNGKAMCKPCHVEVHVTFREIF